MPSFTLTKEERRIAEGCRFWGMVLEEVIELLRLANDERKRDEVVSLYIRGGARLQ